ncbi:MAG: DEAD/DEAH box helicase [Paenibacillaceae bacterium]
MDRYMFKLDRKLLDLNAVEMDDGLVHFFSNLADSSEMLEFVNEAGISRKISVNLAEKLLQGRGIKGFFAPYSEHYMFIAASPEGNILVSSLSPQKKNWLKQVDEKLAVRERTEMVVNAMNTMQQDDPAWFDLYHVARGLVFPQKDNLMCLPYLRDIETYGYQLKTVKAVIERFKGRALLCDEVGLGKTVEAGICMLEYIMRGLARKILILVPPSLINQWHEELKRKFNQDFIRADDPLFVKMGSDAWNHYPKVIASISSAKRATNSSTISQIHYDLVIVDEAHHLKNRATVAWQFVNSLKKNYILLLTATPVQNSLEELYNLITLLKPGQLKTYSYFKKNFVEDNEGIEAKNVNKLKGLLSEVMIRNRRSNVDVKFTKRSAHTKFLR